MEENPQIQNVEPITFSYLSKFNKSIGILMAAGYIFLSALSILWIVAALFAGAAAAISSGYSDLSVFTYTVFTVLVLLSLLTLITSTLFRLAEIKNTSIFKCGKEFIFSLFQIIPLYLSPYVIFSVLSHDKNEDILVVLVILGLIIIIMPLLLTYYFYFKFPKKILEPKVIQHSPLHAQ